MRFLRQVHEARTSSTLILEDLVMRELSDIIILMVNLHTLTISSCGLRSVNPNIKRLTNLTYLELDNDLVVVPEDATRISNLTELRLNKNQMKNYRNLQQVDPMLQDLRHRQSHSHHSRCCMRNAKPHSLGFGSKQAKNSA